jgi:hypothetical protein
MNMGITSAKEVATSPDITKKSLFKRLGLTYPHIHSKTSLCKHELGCIENILNDASRSFAIGYLVRASLNLIDVLLKLSKLKSK